MGTRGAGNCERHGFRVGRSLSVRGNGRLPALLLVRALPMTHVAVLRTVSPDQDAGNLLYDRVGIVVVVGQVGGFAPCPSAAYDPRCGAANSIPRPRRGQPALRSHSDVVAGQVGDRSKLRLVYRHRDAGDLVFQLLPQPICGHRWVYLRQPCLNILRVERS